MAKEYRHIGKATQRIDALEILTGKAKYVDDLKIPQMIYGKVLRSPFPHAHIRSIDTGKAEELPGVKAVLTYENVPDWKTGWPPHRLVLDRKVRFVGDGVALVAGVTGNIAEEALALIDVEYEELQAVYDMEEALSPRAPQLYEEFPGNDLPLGFDLMGPTCLKDLVLGDVEKGFQEADFIVEGTYGYECIPNPLPAESPGIIARWEESGKLTSVHPERLNSLN
jgi:CO/xanthine dehydrogenase Mo-binding subunit